jgi:hypothetical protein
MKECKKCQGEIPKYLWIEGKRKNLQNRKFCLICSPWGEHNTRDLVGNNTKKKEKTHCYQCDRPFNSNHKRNLAKCQSCYFNDKKIRRIEKVKLVTGNKCWFCGYNRTWNNLAFHHVDPDNKVMNLSSRELVGFSWKKVYAEMQKCILCCHNCHGEIHAGLIEESEVKKHHEFWNKQFDK